MRSLAEINITRKTSFRVMLGNIDRFELMTKNKINRPLFARGYRL
jgi:hypothetical protein